MRIETIACPCCGSEDYDVITKTKDYEYYTTHRIFSVVKCMNCGLLYLNPRPVVEEIGRMYPKEYSAYHFGHIKNPVIRRARGVMQLLKVQKIVSRFGNVKNPNILDVGCGEPVLLTLLRKLMPRANLFGNDINPKVREALHKEGLKILWGRLEDTHCASGYFDIIILNQVIEHFFNLTRVLENLRRIMSATGRLFIETPSAEGLDAKIFRKRNWGGYHAPRHLQIFTAETISTTLSKSGFEVETISYLPSPTFWTSSFRNLLYIKGFPEFITRRMNYRNVFCMTLFTSLDLLTRIFLPTSNMRVVARKSAE